MIVITKFSRKICGITVVSRRMWFDVAVWDTARSALKGWSFKLDRGFRLTTPLIGIGCSLVFGGGE